MHSKKAASILELVVIVVIVICIAISAFALVVTDPVSPDCRRICEHIESFAGRRDCEAMCEDARH